METLSVLEKEMLMISFSNAFDIDLSNDLEAIYGAFALENEGRNISAEQRSYRLPFADSDGNEVVVPGNNEKMRRKSHMDMPDVQNVPNDLGVPKKDCTFHSRVRKIALPRSKSVMRSLYTTNKTVFNNVRLETFAHLPIVYAFNSNK